MTVYCCRFSTQEVEAGRLGKCEASQVCVRRALLKNTNKTKNKQKGRYVRWPVPAIPELGRLGQKSQEHKGNQEMGEEVGNRICGRSPVLNDGSLWKLKWVNWMRQEKVADLCGCCSQASLLLGSKEQALHVKGSEFVPTT